VKPRFLAFAVLLALVLGLPALAQQKTDAPPLPATPGNVTLSLDEYNRLLALANRPGKKTENPPLPYLLKRADLSFHVVNDDVVGSIQFEGETLAANTTKVPLATGMTVLDARHGAKPLPLLLENGMHTAMLPGESEFAVTLDAGIPLSIETGRASFSILVPSAGSVRLTLNVPGERTNVQLSHGIITHRSSEHAQTEIEATLTPGQLVNVWWTTREVVAPVVPREVRFLSDVKSLVSVSESDLQIAALVDITVVQGESSQFSIPVPEGFEVTAVNGPTLESSEVQAGVLLLTVSGHASAHQFLVTMEKPISDAKAAAPILAVKGAQRETGEVLVEGQGTIELTASESGGLKRLDIKEINPYLRALARYSLQAAFRYHRQPNESPALDLEWTRFPDSSVLAAVVERATVTTLVTSEGKSLTEVNLTLKNQAQPFLKVDLPSGATILTAEVSGEKVKPVQGADGARVPLLRAGLRPAGAYTVSFVFLHSGAPFAKKGGSDISLPKMDVPIDILEWEIFLPDQFKVKDFSGDAISVSLLPPEYRDYENAASWFRAGGEGGGVSSVVGAGIVNPLTANALARLAPGQLGGYVLDPTGAVVTNASIAVNNTATGGTWNTSTNPQGSWFLAGLPSGNLRITISSPGFRNMVQNIYYDASHPEHFNVSLNIGTVAESIEVTAGNAMQDSRRIEKELKKNPPPPPPPSQASANVFNLQQRVAGVLPVAVEVPRAGTSYRFVRPLVVNEETTLSFTYKSK
jgi:carboxypeptidase family protein